MHAKAEDEPIDVGPEPTISQHKSVPDLELKSETKDKQIEQPISSRQQSIDKS